MYRYQFHIQVQLGHFADFKALHEELNASLRAKDLVPFKLWEAAVGRLNEFLMVADTKTSRPTSGSISPCTPTTAA